MVGEMRVRGRNGWKETQTWKLTQTLCLTKLQLGSSGPQHPGSVLMYSVEDITLLHACIAPLEQESGQASLDRISTLYI